MTVTARRLAGVLVAAVTVTIGVTVYRSLRTQELGLSRARATAAAEGELLRVEADLQEAAAALSRRAAQGANLDAVGALLSEVTSQSDVDALAATFAEFEQEPWFAPYARTGPHAFFLGVTPLYASEPAFTAALTPLAERASSAGTAAATISHGGGVWLVGAGRSLGTNPQQQPAVLVMAERLSVVALEPMAARLGVAVSLMTHDTSLAAGPGPQLEALQRLAGAEASPSDGCCARKQLADDLTLFVHRDPAPDLRAAEAEASKAALPVFGVAGVMALAALVFAFFPRRERESEELLRQTAAQLERSQEELKRLSQRLAVADVEAPSGTTRIGVDQPLGATQASVQASRYETVAPLGEGGMARVSVAVVRGAEGFRRLFVVKRLRPELAGNQEVVSQFIDEARLGASLVHSNIVPVFDFGRDAEGYYLAQEYILGRDVDALIDASKQQRGRALEPELVVHVAVEVARALAYAHSRTNDAGQPVGLVHRDVSPNNLMVSARGEVKLLDFGIVKSDERSTRTQAGVVKGNLFFMSPEQARALPVDRRSDLFSLGMVLVSALTGTPLYSGGTMYELMTRAAAGPTDADRARVRAQCGALAPVVLKAISLDPADRFDDAEAFARALLSSGVPPASSADLQALVERLFGAQLAQERARFTVPA
ncbi:MAG: protein kinase domain-containing protein [Archangium sp.]